MPFGGIVTEGQFLARKAMLSISSFLRVTQKLSCEALSLQTPVLTRARKPVANLSTRVHKQRHVFGQPTHRSTTLCLLEVACVERDRGLAILPVALLRDHRRDHLPLQPLGHPGEWQELIGTFEAAMSGCGMGPCCSWSGSPPSSWHLRAFSKNAETQLPHPVALGVASADSVFGGSRACSEAVLRRVYELFRGQVGEALVPRAQTLVHGVEHNRVAAPALIDLILNLAGIVVYRRKAADARQRLLPQRLNVPFDPVCIISGLALLSPLLHSPDD